jgi:hypothetical protein
MNDEQIQKCHKIAEHYGYENQSRTLQEEYAELIQAVDGWEVDAITYMADHNGKMMKAYRVDKCPKFERG